MKVLLDTHFVQRLVATPNTISRREHAVISRSDIVISAVSIWELRIKWQKHSGNRRRRDLLDPAAALQFIVENEIELAPLTAEDCAATLDTPVPHRDPFDEMLLIHAQRLGAKLLTRDGDLEGHPLVVQLS